MPFGLTHWPRSNSPFVIGPPITRADRAVVFIHGIFSDHNTFKAMHRRFSERPSFAGFECFYYDYDFNESLEMNGQELSSVLAKNFRDDDFVVVVAHSMGGLVARLAVLTRQMKFLHCLFLLGTPNVGAIRTAQLALLAELVQETAGAVFAIFPRKSGIVDLTRAAEIIDKNRGNAPYARDIDYVTIPGLYYHERRRWFERTRDLATIIFTILRFGFSILEIAFPPFSIKLSKPHDGVVEESSNNLIPSTAGRWSEKNDSINFPATTPISYAHVELENCQDLTHVHLQSDIQVFEVIADIIGVAEMAWATPAVPSSPLASRLLKWRDSLKPANRRGVMNVKTH